MIAMLLARWRETMVVVAVIAGLAAWRARDRALEARGVALERARVADSTLAAITPQLARVDTVLVEQIRTVPKVIVATDTLRDTVLTHLTDTVLVERYVHVADSAVRACHALLVGCAAYRELSQQKIAALEAKLAAVPPVRGCRSTGAVAALMGVAAGYLIPRR